MGISFEEVRPAEFDQNFYRLDLLHAMDDWAKDAIKILEGTTEYWKEPKPVFAKHLSTGGKSSSMIVIDVSTDDPVYNYLNYGVEAHDIIPRKREKSGTAGTFKASSMPGTLKVSQGGKGTGFYLNLNWVIPWPGIKAREFYQQTADQLEEGAETNLQFRMQQALDKAATRAYKKKGE
jgi:hypothetical protein